uniref:CX domain-containing protein n=1 Tax=Syphacia muris TaxID=451379 RepID=A0A158R4F7_9BILA
LGAATGVLAYEAGKHIIRSIATIVCSYRGRSYYWGSDYYRGSPGGQMCRKPITQGDATFGDIYMNDGYSRPKEIVWSCGWNEYCCGMDCCYRGDASSYRGFTFGYVLRCYKIFRCRCYLVLICHHCHKF